MADFSQVPTRVGYFVPERFEADAQNLEAGDIARVILPFRSSGQAHGMWATDAELGLV